MKKNGSILSRLRGVLNAEHEDASIAPSERLRLSGKGLRVPIRNKPFVVEMGKQTLNFLPDLPLVDSTGKELSDEAVSNHLPCDFLVFDPLIYGHEIAQTLRLSHGKKLRIDYRQENQKLVFTHSRDAFRRYLQVSHEGDYLVFSDPISELGTYLYLLQDEAPLTPLNERRRQKLKKLTEIFGGPLEILPPEEALETVRQVNQGLKDDSYRRKDSYGNAGGVVELPYYLAPIIVGDLHAQVDNLLKILVENSFLDCLERGDAALILLGDAVHSENKGELDNMDKSVLMMDLIFKLKLRFPEQVFFVVGNHDSFSADVMKAGVPQSLIWEKRITELRGKEFREEMALFYRQSPLVVLAEDFVACHAGPPRSPVNLDMLVEVRQFPELVHDLTWNRVKTRGFPLGYTRREVRQFRRSLELDEHTPFVVAHYPQSKDGTFWPDVGGIANHHVVYSARQDRLAVYTRVQGEMISQIYASERLLGLANRSTHSEQILNP